VRKGKLGKHHFLHRVKQHRGFVTILLLLIVITLAVLLAGSFKKDFAPSSGAPLSSTFTCCDSGDGDNCKPIESKKFTHNGQEYALLKSNIKFTEGSFHLKDSGEKFNGDPIILNNSDGYNSNNHPGAFAACNGEAIFGPSRQCVLIPKGEIIYVCRSNCEFTNPDPKCNLPQVTCYGNDKTTYDVYFRLADLSNPGIPNTIKNCVKSDVTGVPGQPTIIIEQQPKRVNLQLQTFKIISQSGATPWFSPWCKPAVYLYPKTTSFVNVKVNSNQPLTYTDPLYPPGGWSVLADPTGIISYGNKFYDYLYYETRVADENLTIPDKGFVVKKGELASLFSEILPKLGLNVKEAQQFSDYWLKVLPHSPYYFVGIIPQTNLNSLTSLNVAPRPTTVIRVTLYFKPLEQKIDVAEPVILPVKRAGFTVVEWGGIYKKDKNHDFSCLQ